MKLDQALEPLRRVLLERGTAGYPETVTAAVEAARTALAGGADTPSLWELGVLSDGEVLEARRLLAELEQELWPALRLPATLKARDRALARHCLRDLLDGRVDPLVAAERIGFELCPRRRPRLAAAAAPPMAVSRGGPTGALRRADEGAGGRTARPGRTVAGRSAVLTAGSDSASARLPPPSRPHPSGRRRTRPPRRRRRRSQPAPPTGSSASRCASRPRPAKPRSPAVTLSRALPCREAANKR